MQTAMLTHGRGPFQWMMPSAYMSARIFHLAPAAALAVQAPFTLFAVVVAAWAWRRPGRPLELRAATLMLATFVASPQCFNYDLIPASVAAVVLLRRGRQDAATLILVMLAWATPVAMIALEGVHAPVAPIVLTAALALLAMLPDAEPSACRPPAALPA